jgi:predicted unusual protein kinase regulating ubiquinone biosynthesis (AarF/ABC1/UbiB family)
MDLRPVLREWCAEIPKELDFRTEAENLIEVRGNLELHSDIISCRVPKPVAPSERLPAATERVLVMEYMKGSSIRSVAELISPQRGSGQGRGYLLEHISRSFAQQIFVGGFFNGDPHPVNLLVQAEEDLTKRSWRMPMGGGTFQCFSISV